MELPGQPHDRNALVLYGSETGNAQDAAGELGRMTERLRFSTTVTELDQANVFSANNVSKHDLFRYSIVLFAIATTGQGELPGNAQRFWKRLRSKRLPPGHLSNVNFASFGLGDSSYPQFNWAHRKLYNRLVQLGAISVFDRGESDEQHPEGIEGCLQPWIVKLKTDLLEKFPLTRPLSPIPDDEFLIPKWAIKISENVSVTPSKIQNGQDAHHEAEPPVSQEQLNGHDWKRLPETALENQSIQAPGIFASTLVKNQRLTPPEHWQDVRLFEFRCPRLDYSPGDILTIFPKNSMSDVELFISLMDWTQQADLPITFEPTSLPGQSQYYPPAPFFDKQEKLTIRTLLANHLDITSIPRRSFFASIVHFTNDEMQKERLLEFINPEYVDELYDYTSRPRRSIIEVLHEFDTVKIPIQWAASVIPHIRGRQFSIASGGRLKYADDGAGRIELLVAIVKYRTVIKKIREGLCTKYLAALEPGTKLEVLLCKGGMTHRMERPAIMVGPGTGLAPLRSLIHERVAAGSVSQNILFFGGRNRSADYFFEHEWKAIGSTAQLEVYPAFSRDQRNKIYVQDLIREHGQEVYQALEAGASVYICGSSGKMPQAVRDAIVEVLEQHGPMEQTDAEARLKSMEKDARYQQETW